MDTSGFYKLDGDLLYGQTIFGPTYILVNESHADYTYPVDGWYWFLSEDEAITYLLGDTIL